MSTRFTQSTFEGSWTLQVERDGLNQVRLLNLYTQMPAQLKTPTRRKERSPSRR